MRLIQIPFSHNCIKVRRTLELKNLAYDTLDITPMDRKPVVASSGQPMVPALEDGEVRVADSTRILRHLEAAYPARPLQPDGEALRAECWLLEDWADGAFMQLSRRLAYWELIHTPDAIARLWFEKERGLKRSLMTRVAHRVLRKRFHLTPEKIAQDTAEAPRLAGLALERLGGRTTLFDGGFTVADIALASMSAPLFAAPEPVRNDPAVRDLIAWGDGVLGPELADLYKKGP